MDRYAPARTYNFRQLFHNIIYVSGTLYRLSRSPYSYTHVRPPESKTSDTHTHFATPPKLNSNLTYHVYTNMDVLKSEKNIYYIGIDINTYKLGS